MSLQQETTAINKLNPIALSLAIALSSVTLPTFAQEVQAEDQEEKLAIEVVTVTARHKVESLQSTPIAVSAFGSEQLKEQKIQGLADISSNVPGFQMNMYNSSEPELFMRGIGSDVESAGAGAAVGMYIDGVYISRGTGAAMDLYDLHSVEVLRGPQGTLYGKNVVGGAINFITKRPVDGDMEWSVEGTVGNYGLVETKGFVTGSLTENVAGKLALSGVTRDGYGKNTFTGNDADDLTRHSARGQLLFTPTSSLEILLTAGYSNSDATPRMKHISYSAGRNAAFISSNPRNDASSVDNFEDSESSSLSMQIDYETSIGQLTSITAHRSNDYTFFENAAAGLVDNTQRFEDCGEWGGPSVPCEWNTVESDEELAALQPDDEWLSLKAEDSSQFSQEFRLTGSGEKFSWLAGAFFMKEDIKRNEAVEYWFHAADQEFGFSYGTLVGNEEILFFDWNTGMEHPSTLGNTTNNVTNSYALFGNVSYDITDKLSITAGLRWSEDEKEFSGTAYGKRFDNATNMHIDLEGNDVFSYKFETTDSWDEWTPSVNLDYQASKDSFYYLSIAKGYKAGGFNGEGMEDAREAITPFLPEVAWNYEAGFKVQGLEDRLRVNGAVFYTDYTDIQSAVWTESEDIGIPELVVINGSGRAQGVELEVTALISEQFSVSGSYGFLDAEFTKDVFVDDESLKGNDMRRTPDHSLNINATYEWEAADIGEFSARLAYQYTSEFFFDNSNDPLTEVDAQDNIDASLMLRSFDDTWSVQLWVKNVTDELNVASTTVYTAWDPTAYTVYQPPRTIGLTASYRY